MIFPNKRKIFPCITSTLINEHGKSSISHQVAWSINETTCLDTFTQVHSIQFQQIQSFINR